eukprot:CAMPEP_0194482258 /NCGR_PEP_ID=MMETSP0253-20130528/4292_1 /TAXON_ID=2966 /ORGANISM="Noctiluca scintillans" /LENGTH=446 /DNA_ID=CAMNT_0039321787 /DNA_START=39 /DNA_END=1379 /DNA_ORIENTATION=+
MVVFRNIAVVVSTFVASVFSSSLEQQRHEAEALLNGSKYDLASAIAQELRGTRILVVRAMITTVWEQETSAAPISTSATAAVTILCVVPVQFLPDVALQVRPALGVVLEEVVVARASEVVAVSTPPLPSVAADWYNESRARAFAAIAAAAECGPEGAFGLNPWTCPECEAAGFALLPDKTFIARKDFDTSDALFAFVATMTSAGRGDRSRENVDLKQPACVLSFRGTDNIANWKRNFQICNQSVLEAWPDASPCVGCGVHKGFYKIYDGLYHGEGGIYATLVKLGCGPGSGRQVFVTGHSLGGGIAPLAMFDLKNKGFDIGLSYTFNAPRSGNRKWARTFDAHFGRDVSVFRITRRRDMISHTPARDFFGDDYRHVGSEAFYGLSWNDRVQVCGGSEDPKCSRRYAFADAILSGQSVQDHCDTALTPWGSMCDYAPFCNPADEAVV